MTWRPRARGRFRLDADSLEQLYRQYAEDFTSFFLRRVTLPADALDLMAETFARGFELRRRFRGQSEREALAWLYGIARNLLLHYHRDGRVALRAIARLGLERPDVTDAELERLEDAGADERLHAAVAAGLDGLPAPQRHAVLLRVVDERTYKEIAEELGISEQSARTRVSRGLRAIGAQIQDGAA
jgi:RNA polymerase sigma-70 factor (ECF subfamily)